MDNRTVRLLVRLMLVTLIVLPLFGLSTIARAQTKAEKSKFIALVTDGQGVETELKQVIFYWEEKLSETSFVPHELTYIPVKQGHATVNIRFDKIQQIGVKPGADKGLPAVTITLANGKTGEFHLAVKGSFKGETDFGEVELPAETLRKIMFK